MALEIGGIPADSKGFLLVVQVRCHACDQSIKVHQSLIRYAKFRQARHQVLNIANCTCGEHDGIIGTGRSDRLRLVI